MRQPSHALVHVVLRSTYMLACPEHGHISDQLVTAIWDASFKGKQPIEARWGSQWQIEPVGV